MYVCVCTCVCVHACVCLHACMHVWVCVCLHVRVCTQRLKLLIWAPCDLWPWRCTSEMLPCTSNMFLLMPRCCAVRYFTLTFEAPSFIWEIYWPMGHQMFSVSLCKHPTCDLACCNPIKKYEFQLILDINLAEESHWTSLYFTIRISVKFSCVVFTTHVHINIVMATLRCNSWICFQTDIRAAHCMLVQRGTENPLMNIFCVSER